MALASKSATHVDVFACYTGDAQRSLNEVARLMKVPLGGIKWWAHQHQRAGRVKAEDEACALLGRAHADELLVRNLAKRITHMEALSGQNENREVAENATR